MDLFDHAASRLARDVGMKLVLDHNPKWSELVLAFIEGLPQGWTGLAEDIRRVWHGPAPDHHNAWGAVINAAVKQGLLVNTGARPPMASKRSHARSTPQYRRV